MTDNWYGNLVYPNRPASFSQLHAAVNALIGNPKAKPQAGMFAARPAPPPRENLKAAPETVGSRIQSGVTNALMQLGMSKYGARQFGARTVNFLNDVTPVGGATEAEQARNSWRQGNYLNALAHGALAAMSVVPDGGAATGKVLHSIIAPVFHGSPHKFEKFALEKIGTGEGAQAYGHGLYFAENPAVAQQYQSTVSLQHAGVDWGSDPASAAAYWLGMGKDRESAIRTFENMKLQHQRTLDRAAKGLPLAPGALANSRNEIAQADAAIEHLRNGTERKGLGHLYEVSLDANPEDFLDWDAPLSQQPRAMEALRGLNLSVLPEGNRTRRMLEMELAGQGQPHYPATGRELLNVASNYGEQRAAEHAALMPYGIKGVQYLDQGSRGLGNGTRNYVVYDPSMIDILARH